ncbi:MAG: hypothetical protein ABI600_03990 [Luteolibacter sp.]
MDRQPNPRVSAIFITLASGLMADSCQEVVRDASGRVTAYSTGSGKYPGIVPPTLP